MKYQEYLDQDSDYQQAYTALSTSQIELDQALEKQTQAHAEVRLTIEKSALHKSTKNEYLSYIEAFTKGLDHPFSSDRFYTCYVYLPKTTPEKISALFAIVQDRRAREIYRNTCKKKADAFAAYNQSLAKLDAIVAEKKLNPELQQAITTLCNYIKQQKAALLKGWEWPLLHEGSRHIITLYALTGALNMTSHLLEKNCDQNALVSYQRYYDNQKGGIDHQDIALMIIATIAIGSIASLCFWVLPPLGITFFVFTALFAQTTVIIAARKSRTDLAKTMHDVAVLARQSKQTVYQSTIKNNRIFTPRLAPKKDKDVGNGAIGDFQL